MDLTRKTLSTEDYAFKEQCIEPKPLPDYNRGMSAHIALVDDDRNILTSVSIAMQAEGYVTRIYSDGETALKALLENPADLGIFDIKMPRMDGLELLRRLREKSDMPVIFLTSKDEELDEARAYMEECLSLTPKWCRSIPVSCETGIGPSYGDAK